MALEDVINTWEQDSAYHAVVIACDVQKPNHPTRPAKEVYKGLMPFFNYQDDNFCTSPDITSATHLIRAFLIGHAGSLAAGVPLAIDPDRDTEAKSQILDDLERVRNDIVDGGGVYLPSVREGPRRKVLKIHFAGQDGAPIPDPWLLAAKAAVNLSSTQGQKLLPACIKDEEENDPEFWQMLHEYELRRLQMNLPLEVSLSRTGGGGPSTPLQTNPNGTTVVTPPQRGEDDWENLGDSPRQR